MTRIEADPSGLASARAVADAVLLEGYVLYPYRSSSTKNQFRWNLGVLAPRDWSEAGGCEPSWMEASFLLDARPGGRIDGRLRFLQMERRQVERATPEGGFAPVERLETDDGRLHVSWDEGELREMDLGPIDPRLTAGATLPFRAPGGETIEPLRAGDGTVIGRVRRTRRAVDVRVRVCVEPLGAAPDGPEESRRFRVRLRVEDVTPWADPSAPRAEVLGASCISTHLLLAAHEGEFLSLLDPPPGAEAAAEGCTQVRCFPVLAGAPGRRDLLLVSPIILYDHPQVAPESPGDFFDAAEIDELLTLRTATLTPEEKRQARATDPRAAAILDRVDAMPPEVIARLHGAIRERARLEPSVEPAEPSFRPGSRVRLAPGRRRTDAQDLLYAGLEATVQEVRQDVDGQQLLAVTIDGDPAAELHRWYGRFHYYHPDEVEPLGDEPEGAAGAEDGPESAA
jgi:hypothetical protein